MECQNHHLFKDILLIASIMSIMDILFVKSELKMSKLELKKVKIK